MSKPTIKRTVTGSDCLNYVNNAIGFVSTFPNASSDVKIGLDTMLNFYTGAGELAGQMVHPTNYTSFVQYRRNTEYIRFSHTGRVVGLILDENDDGSYKIAVLGNDILQWGHGNNDTLDMTRLMHTIQTPTLSPDNNDMYNFPELMAYEVPQIVPNYTYANIRKHDFSEPSDVLIPLDEARDYKMTLTRANSSYSSLEVFERTGEYQGVNLVNLTPQQVDGTLALSTNKNNTLVLGKAWEDIANIEFNENAFMYDTYGTIFDAWEGNLYDLLFNISVPLILQSQKKPAVVVAEGGQMNLYTRADLGGNPKLAGYEGKTHAFNFVPFNLILTKSETQALSYLSTGAVPSDAFLYPLDWENLPRTDGTPSSDDESTDDTDYPNPNGDSGIDGTPTEDADPVITTNMLNNNNLYWLQAGQLEAFITWFWQHAGEIIDLEDAWQKLTGLYNNIAEAIVNIRYFPVDPYYIGGVSDTTNIILSSIEMEITGIKKLNKGKLVKRTLGGINIPKKYGMFTDYSPYTSIMLYLPFHGWVELDIDLFVGNRLEVRCVYDHISGTIQYGIYVISKGKEFLVNSCVAKMAVDIPITLQSKSDRDSAIFQNVASGVGNFLGAGASIAQGNPIGLVMSTGGLASGGSQSAPLKTMGTMGESGAFFLPHKCAYYIKRPSYNIPSDYASRVGYPSNQGGKLSSFRGLTVVYNPQISFKGNENADGVTMKPLESEIKEIYELLEKGVII